MMDARRSGGKIIGEPATGFRLNADRGLGWLHDIPPSQEEIWINGRKEMIVDRGADPERGDDWSCFTLPQSEGPFPLVGDVPKPGTVIYMKGFPSTCIDLSDPLSSEPELCQLVVIHKNFLWNRFFDEDVFLAVTNRRESTGGFSGSPAIALGPERVVGIYVGNVPMGLFCGLISSEACMFVSIPEHLRE